MADCAGCLNIKHRRFPFERCFDVETNLPADFGIDMEGCGDGPDDAFVGSTLKIFFCPVCGKKLEPPSNEED